MSKCKNCKWFKPKKHPEVCFLDDLENQYLEDFGGCSNPIFYYLGDTMFEKKKAVERRVKGKLFLYEDAERCKAYFYVHEDFGCIGFKHK